MITPAKIVAFLKRIRKNIEQRVFARLATNSAAGVMSAADKAKLDSITFDFDRGTLTVVSNGVTLTFAAIKEATP